MADDDATFTFEVTEGPYKGRYEIGAREFTGTESLAFYQATGVAFESMLGGHMPMTSFGFAGFVWLIRRRSTRNLLYKAVNDHINMAIIDIPDQDAIVEDSDAIDADSGSPVDPEG